MEHLVKIVFESSGLYTEAAEVVSVFTHVLYRSGPQLAVMLLGAIELVRACTELTVTVTIDCFHSQPKEF